MKLVITTQHLENYGAHDWDGEGECPQYWKCKGGNVYVVRDLSAKSVAKIRRDGIPNLEKLISINDESWQEYIIGLDIVEDDSFECEEWDSVTEFRFVGGRWTCVRVRDSLCESWVPGPAGERSDYKSEVICGQGLNLLHTCQLP